MQFGCNCGQAHLHLRNSKYSIISVFASALQKASQKNFFAISVLFFDQTKSWPKKTLFSTEFDPVKFISNNFNKNQQINAKWEESAAC